MSEATRQNVSSDGSSPGEYETRGGDELSDEAIDFAHRMFDLARNGSEEHLCAALKAGLPPDICTSKGDSLLMLACYNGHLGCAQALLDSGADAELANDRNQTPLAGVIFKDDMALVDLLLARGADVNGGPAGAKTPLMYAALFNRRAMLERLLEAGADLTCRDADGKSALDLARAMGADEAVVLLSAS